MFFSSAKQEQTSNSDVNQLSVQARTLAEALPELLVEAQNLANTVAAGWHGRKKAGLGETFWQFRPFYKGEPAKRIDWRRSARDNHLYVREREWEASHTLWLWADLSRSMTYQSTLASTTKRDRALLLLLALANLLAEGGERVGLLGMTSAKAGRAAAQKLAETLAGSQSTTSFPPWAQLKRFSEVILFSDLFDEKSLIEQWVISAAASGAKGHLVQIIDPIEETFPFTGRAEFSDPEKDFTITAGRAEEWKQQYLQVLASHRDFLETITTRSGWSFSIHHSDRPAQEALLTLYSRLSNSPMTNVGGTPF
ncbi:DUF58 domain-containing protein [Flexibacterium corallicola]|uniref:DUF58 domain-containing protein n=1 Tax=Flexibacterium corallicola TaxID=3037259 RepID=UPI00286F53B7|nr:DUF58 domain-containing protein [Pseudovibrio sp. M1P-2-3]